MSLHRLVTVSFLSHNTSPAYEIMKDGKHGMLFPSGKRNALSGACRRIGILPISLSCAKGCQPHSRIHHLKEQMMTDPPQPMNRIVSILCEYPETRPRNASRALRFWWIPITLLNELRGGVPGECTKAAEPTCLRNGSPGETRFVLRWLSDAEVKVFAACGLRGPQLGVRIFRFNRNSWDPRWWHREAKWSHHD